MTQSISAHWELEDEFPGRLTHKGGECFINSQCVLRHCVQGHCVHGHSVHVHAYRVTEDDQGVQVAHDPQFQEEVEALQNLCGGALSASRIQGYPGLWVVTAFPHGA